MEARMTICNMTIEAGARAGMVAPDETTFAYLKGRPNAPQGTDWDAALAYWRTLRTDPGATFDREVVLDGEERYELNGDDSRSLATVGAFRVVPDSDQPETNWLCALNICSNGSS